ncbi:hypothetical protein D3C72_2051360 [compost metagenome]
MVTLLWAQTFAPTSVETASAAARMHGMFIFFLAFLFYLAKYGRGAALQFPPARGASAVLLDLDQVKQIIRLFTHM